MGLRPTQGDEKRLGPATTLYLTVALSFVIPSEAEGSAVPRTFPGNVFRPERSVAICGSIFGCNENPPNLSIGENLSALTRNHSESLQE